MSVATNFKPKPNRSRVWIIPITGLVIFALLLGWHAFKRNLTEQEFAAQIAAIRAQGYPTSAADLDAWYPEPPVADNAALVYGTAFNQITGVPPSTPWFDTQSSSNILSRTNPIPPAARSELASLVASNQAPLKLLHDGARLPSSRYPINLSGGFNATFSHLNGLKNATRVLTYESLDHALNARLAASIDSLIVSLRVGHSLSNEPVIISSLLQCAAYTQTATSLENILSRASFDPSTVKPLLDEILRAEHSLHPQRAFAGERAIGLDAFGNSVQIFGANMNSPAASSSPSFGTKLTASAYDALLKESDRRTYLEVMEEYISACTNEVTRLNPALKEASASFNQKLANTYPLRMLLTRMMLPSLEKAGERHVTTIAQLRLARLALILQSGPHPESLSALNEIPLDPFDGKPLRYRRTETGFMIWSIGPDGIDQGGKPRQKNSGDAYDLVFTVEKSP
ncbi:MAG TPA: hypothetical protein VGH19_17600 [Verrucomicrobiae bacterium]